MADKTLEILIKTVADTTGITLTRDQAQELTTALGKQAAASEDLGKSTAEATEKMRLFHGEGREMHKIISEITRISPALGEAFRIMMNPVAGSIAAAIGLFVLLKEHIKEVNAELDAMADAAANPQFLDGIKARQDVLRAASIEAQDYAFKLKASEHSITDELTAQLALQTAINGANAAQASAESSLAQAKINADVASGKITPEEGVLRSADVKRQAILDTANAATAAQQQELATKQKAAADLSLKLPGGHAQAAAMRDSVSAEAARRKSHEEFKDRDKLNAAIAEKDAADENYKKKFSTSEGGGSLGWMTSPEELAAAKGRQDLAAKQVQILSAGNAAYNADLKSEPEFNARKEAADQARTTAESQDKLAKEIAALTAVIKGTQTANAATTRAKLGEVTTEEIGSLLKIIPQNQEAGRSLGLHPDDVHLASAKAELNTSQQTGRLFAQGLVQAQKEHNKDLEAAYKEALAEIRASNAALIAQIKNSGNRGFSQ